jgi:hypothetical protein
MRSHPEEAQKYSQDINKYNKGKNDFIAEIDSKAVEWKKNN